MPSASLDQWLLDRANALDEIERAHRSVGGTGRGRRYATQQINQAYAVLLSSQFQGFCRDLHSECAGYLVAPVVDADLRTMSRAGLVQNRKLDRGNPNAGNLGADFGRFNLAFWPRVDAHRIQNPQRRAALEELNDWRNAIAHQDFAPTMLRASRPVLHLAQVQMWRKVCHGLAQSFDEVLRTHIQSVTGTSPW